MPAKTFRGANPVSLHHMHRRKVSERENQHTLATCSGLGSYQTSHRSPVERCVVLKLSDAAWKDGKA